MNYKSEETKHPFRPSQKNKKKTKKTKQKLTDLLLKRILQTKTGPCLSKPGVDIKKCVTLPTERKSGTS